MKYKKRMGMIITSYLIIFILFASGNTMGITNWIFRDKDYEEKIEKKIYMLYEEQLCDLFSSNGNDVVQYGYGKLYDKNNYLVICLKNTGNKAAWGTLHCDVEKRFFPEISIGHLTPNMNRFVFYVIPLTGMFFPKDDVLPHITTKWKKLYSK